MAKYCKAYKLKVTYLDCLECETKECKQTARYYKKRIEERENKYK